MTGPAGRPPLALVDFTPDGPAPGGPLLFDAPRAVFEAWAPADVPGVLARAESAALGGAWAVGFVAYEAAPAFDPALRVRAPGEGDPRTPLACFAVFDAPRAGGADVLAAARPAGAEAAWTPEAAGGNYEAWVRETRAGIARGDYYQVNHTVRLAADAPVEPVALWARLRAAQLGAGGAFGAPAGYGALLHAGPWWVASASPELFFARRGRRLTARPMKGTAPRGRWGGEDDERRDVLVASPKERAENVMIVDLLRNDLGRVAEAGSVRAPRLFVAERYPTVWQMTSTVEAEARAGATLADVFAALFPCGSVTGAPKVAAMARIAACERSARGPYCGAVGVIAPGGDCAFGVAIRTAWGDGCGARFGVGGGVTWDSAPGAEWREAELKARVLTNPPRPAFALLETLRLEAADGRATYPALDGHLARLAASAAYFGHADPMPGARRALAEAAAGALGDRAGVWRVRLTVAPDGHAAATRTPHADAPAVPWRAVLAAEPVDPDDVFLHHKTTHRAAYDRRRATHPDADDVLLVNTRGELTEFTVGNIVVQLGGQRWTPPRASGLLGGVRREALLAAGRVRERVLRPADLVGAEAVWLVNALRGCVPVRVSVAEGEPAGVPILAGPGPR